MAKIAVIGSNSFSAGHFIDYILENTDYEVIGISRSPEYNPIFLPYKRHGDKRFKFYQLDLNNELDKIIELFIKENVGIVVNYAAQGMVGQSWENPLHWFKTNTLSIVAFTDRLRRMPQIKKYVQISTPEIYGSINNLKEEDATYNPSSPYAASKAAGDMFIQTITKQFNFPAVFTRSTNVYGPGQQLYRIIPISIIKIKKGEKIKLQGGGKAVKSYMHIRDNCNGTLKVMESGEIGEVYHLSPDKGYSIESIVRMICERMNTTFENAVEIIDERSGQDKEYILNSEKARKKLNWKPEISIEKGIDECIEWVNKNWDIVKDLPLEYIHKE